MPILVKGDDVRVKQNKRSLRPVTTGTGINGLKYFQEYKTSLPSADKE